MGLSRSTAQSSNPQSAGHEAIVIGSGFGGLAAGVRLQAAGYEVTILEAREKPGGRAYQLQDQGFTFDMGPSLITAPRLLEDIWAAAGSNVHNDITLMPLDPYYRIYFRDGRYFDYGGGDARDEAQIAKFNPDDVEGYRAFLTATERIYERAFADLAGQPFDQLSTFLRVIPELVKLRANRSVYQLVSEYFSDPDLRTVFSFHPLFIGGNPLRASSIYSIVPYLERQGGVYFAAGGTYAVVTAMVDLFTSLGGTLRCGDPVERIAVIDGRVRGVATRSGARFRAPIVVANNDVAATYERLLPRKYRKLATRLHLRRYRQSMSCFLLYFGLDRQYEKLLHHTILMPENYQRLLKNIFDGHKLPSDIACYLHAPTKTDPQLAPPGCESLYALVPVPNLKQLPVDWQRVGAQFRDHIVNFLEHEFGLEGFAASIVVEQRFTPQDFATELRSQDGSAFALEPTLLQSAYLRPHNRSSDIPGLYLVGAGTHPGAGIPGVLLSAAITSKLVIEDFPLAERFRIRAEIQTQITHQ